MGLPSRLRRTTPWLVGAWLLLLPPLTLAATLRVPSEYPSISSAFVVAVAGDSILVAPGSYDQDDIVSFRAGVSLLSEGGWEVTSLRFAWDAGMFDYGAATELPSRLEGFTLLGGRHDFHHPTVFTQNRMIGVAHEGWPFVLLSRSSDITDNIIEGDADPDIFHLFTTDNSINATWRFERNLIRLSGPLDFASVGGWGTNTLILRNNTGLNFVGIAPNSYQQTAHFEIVNNIFYGTPGGGWTLFRCMSEPGVTYDIRYNCWVRGAPMPSCPLGVGNLLATDPQFCDESDDDYRLQPDSPCIGSGEGGTNMGAFGVGCGVTALGESMAPRLAQLLVEPNPVVSSTTFILSVGLEAPVISIYDPTGRLLEILRPTGGRLQWRAAPSASRGVYFARLSGGGVSETTRFILLR